MAALLMEPSAGFPSFPNNLSHCSLLPVQTLFIVMKALGSHLEKTAFPAPRCKHSQSLSLMPLECWAFTEQGQAEPMSSPGCLPVDQMLLVGKALVLSFQIETRKMGLWGSTDST